MNDYTWLLVVDSAVAVVTVTAVDEVRARLLAVAELNLRGDRSPLALTRWLRESIEDEGAAPFLVKPHGLISAHRAVEDIETA